MLARANSFNTVLFVAILASASVQIVKAVDQEVKWTVTGSGSNALRDYVSDGVGNATQDADLGGLYLPFYTEGTGVGQSKFVESTVDYTIGDYPLSSSSYSSLGRPVAQFPIALGAVVVYHSIPGYTSPNTLRLNSSALAGIFAGEITAWDDPIILALNPNITESSVDVAGKNITVCVRTDNNAAAKAFSEYLDVTEPDVWTLGVNSTIKWPDLPQFKTTIGGSNLTALLAKTSYGITFTDAYAGKKAKLTDAALHNKNKDWVKYSNAWWNFTSLGDDKIPFPGLPTDSWANFSIINLGGNKTYPIPTAAMLASNTDLRDKEDRGGAQKQVFGYLLGPTIAKQAPFYQEFPLPPVFLNYSIWATTFMKVRSSLRFFEDYQLPSVEEPYTSTFTLT